MGLFSSLLGGGGGGIDTSYARHQAQQQQDLQRKLYSDLYKQNYPYMAAGGGAVNKLADYLGITPETNEAYYQQFLDPAAKLRGSGKAGNEYVSGGAVNGKTWQVRDDGLYRQDWSGQTPLGDYTRVDTPEPPPPSENFGSLLDPFSMEDYQQSPNFQFNLEQGEQALDRASASRGSYNSPAAIKELLGYSQDLASNEYLNSYNMDAQNKGRIYDMLAGTSGMGQQAVAQQSGNAANYGANMSDLAGQLAQLDLAGQADKAAKRQSAFSNLANIAGLAMQAGSLASGMPGGFGVGGGASFGGRLTSSGGLGPLSRGFAGMGI